MKILVAGGSGFIGGTTSHLLVEEGHEITVFDNLSTGHASNVAGLNLIQGDLCDRLAVESLFASNDIDFVLHFAGKILVGESFEKPLQYFDNNLVGGLNLIHSAALHKVKGFIFSSSAAVYGESTSTSPLKETSPARPINPYGHTKLMVEELLASYWQSHGLPWIALRYFNAAGAYKHIGDNYPEPQHVIPLYLQAIEANQPLDVFGNDHATPDGTCIRDYVHVQDIAQAHIQAIDLLLNKPALANQPINLGSGKGYSVLELISGLEKTVNRSLNPSIKPRRSGDPAQLIADISQAKALLNWEPTHDLDTILNDAYSWYQEHHVS